MPRVNPAAEHEAGQQPLDAAPSADVRANLETVRRLFEAVEHRDLEPMYEIYDRAVVIREADSLPYGGEYRGHEGLVEHALGYVRAWDPLQTDADRDLEARFWADADRVFVLWRQKGRAPDRAQLNLPAISLYRLRGSQVVEARMHHFDTAAIVDFLMRCTPSEDGTAQGRDQPRN